MSTPDHEHAEGQEEANDLASALSRYAASRPEPTPAPPPPPREEGFGLRDTALVLAVAALVTLVLDTEGLLGWAQRLEVGAGQTVLLEVLTPLHAAMAKVGVAAPRRWVAERREQLAEALGGEGDPLLAEGWTLAAAPVEPPPVLPAPVVPVVPSEPEPTPEAPVAAPAPQPSAGAGGVLLLGDSMIAGTLGSTLERTLARGTGLPVARAAQLGTGLARPDVFDWMKVVPALLEREHPKFVVVSLGSNDATNLREGDEVLDYGEARWRQAYLARVEAMMRTLAGTETHVLWLALPPMRDLRLHARGVFLNGVFAQAAKQVRRVEVLPLDVLVGDQQGRYATFITEPDGKLRRYRLDDGVHLAPSGARAVSRWVLDWVAEREKP